MKQKSGWKRITLPRKTSFKERLKILAGYNRQPLPNRVTSELPVTQEESPGDSNWGRRLMIPKCYF